MKLSLRLCLPLLALAPLVALAQPKKAAPSKAAPPTLAPAVVPVAPATQGAGQVDITNAPDGTATYDDAQGLARITKDVVITQRGEKLAVYAQQAVYSRSRNQATATDQLRVVTRDSTIRGVNLRADFNNRQFTISGNVVITSHGKKDGTYGELGGDAKRKAVKVLCDQVVWEYDTKQATATGNIHIYQGANQGTCNKIVYDEDKNVVRLLGGVQFGDNRNRTFVGPEVYFYIDSNIVSADHARIRFPEKDGVDGSSSTVKTPKKTPVPFPSRPVIPADAPKSFETPRSPAPAPLPVATEEPAPTPPADDPTEGETKK